MYSIIDIETTGGSAKHSRITEIAIYIYDGKKIIQEYQTLINPCCEIPYNIIQLTGINNEMVSDAPLFQDVSKNILDITKDQIFVAHNVNFDYGFIQAEFNRIGISFRRKKLCTVRLSRKIFPGKASYSLGRLCENIGIQLNNRHRAAGDAKATVLLFEKLIKNDKNDFIEKSLSPQSLESLIPPNISKSDFIALPEKKGIYYFLNQKKQIVYIGKAKNIKKRVHSHFSGNTNTSTKNDFIKHIYGIDFQEIETDLLVDLIEATEIKKHWPIYNKSMKRISLNHGLFLYQDRNNFLRFNIGNCGKHDKPIVAFKSLEQIKSFLKQVVYEYQLCPRLSGLQPISSGKCNYFEDIKCLGACSGHEEPLIYNKRVNKAINTTININSTYLISEPILHKNRKSIILIEKGRYKGYGIVDSNFDTSNLNTVKQNLNSAYDDQDMLSLVQQHANKLSSNSIIFY